MLDVSCEPSPIGDLTVATDASGVLVRICLPGGPPIIGGRPAPLGAHDEIFEQLRRVLRGEQPHRPLRFSLGGSQFQRAVWWALREIPWGESRTYGEVAAALGRPRSARAVGASCGANSLPLLVPCHRVLARGGRIGGWSGDLRVKMTLLDREGIPYGP